MSASVIPPGKVLRIKRAGGKVELELMRFLTPGQAKARRPREQWDQAWPRDFGDAA